MPHMPQTFEEFLLYYAAIAVVAFLLLKCVDWFPRPKGVPPLGFWAAFWMAVLWPLTVLALFVVVLVAVLFGV